MAFLDENGLSHLWTHICAKFKQPDWNVNDESDSAFVKNRPCYVKSSTNSNLLDTTTANFVDTYGVGIGVCGETFIFESNTNATYTIVFDNVQYEVKLINDGDMSYIGNIGILNAIYGQPIFPVTGEPFLFGLDSPNNFFAYASTAGQHTIQVNLFSEDVCKLPMKYLPEGYPYVSDPVETVLVDNATVELIDLYDSGIYLNFVQADVYAMEMGDNYIVTWNGVSYDVVVRELEGDLFIGNLGIVGAGDDTGEPFIIVKMLDEEGDGFVVYGSEASDVTLSISGAVRKTVKIDNKYLDDSIINTVNNAVLYTSQNLSDYYKTIARRNIGAASSSDVYTDVVRYNTTQNLNVIQKYNARKNIKAVGCDPDVTDSLTNAEKKIARSNIEAISQYDWFKIYGNIAMPLTSDDGINYTLPAEYVEELGGVINSPYFLRCRLMKTTESPSITIKIGDNTAEPVVACRSIHDPRSVFVPGYNNWLFTGMTLDMFYDGSKWMIEVPVSISSGTTAAPSTGTPGSIYIQYEA